jgi:endonuclease/exonuclease/phosphatase family metal-dependent hydrolase
MSMPRPRTSPVTWRCAILGISLVAVACAHAPGSALAPVLPGACRSPELRWYAPDDPQTRARLDAWCAGVGPAALLALSTPPASAVAATDIIFVSWNVHVGNGDLRAFIRDLRAGLLTGGHAPAQFVLLLQEAVRLQDVPAFPPGARGARRISASHQKDQDIEALARDLRLSVAYAPSMRNGARATDLSADRGNAVISTLPLSAPVALELPFRRQRRVALLAEVALSPTSALPVMVIHVDALNTSRRLWVFGTAEWRDRQVRALEPVLPSGPLVVGADLNTWRGEDEPAVRHLRELLGLPAQTTNPSDPRRRVLDYLFLRGAGSATARYVVVPDQYGSDHHPLIGWFSK